MPKILITGCSGFIGSNFINYLLTNQKTEEIKVVNIDKLTYAGRGGNIEYIGHDKDPRYSFIKGDICDSELIKRVIEEYNPKFVFNFAAESHVDRSIEGGLAFVKSNVEGTTNLLEASRNRGLEKFVQVSTDEVYGSINNGSFSENSPLNPSSPYAASKAAAEHMAMAYFKTHKVPLIITRSANNYGPFQFPEKLLSLFITNLIYGRQVPLMWSKENPGLNKRDWLNVFDNCRAIWHVARQGQVGEIYNIPGENERTNMEITKMILDTFGFGEKMIKKIPHRKAHDFRYSIKGDKLRNLGFVYEHQDLNFEIKKVIDWYKKNRAWWDPLKK